MILYNAYPSYLWKPWLLSIYKLSIFGKALSSLTPMMLPKAVPDKGVLAFQAGLRQTYRSGFHCHEIWTSFWQWIQHKSISKPLRRHEQACKNTTCSPRRDYNTHQKDFRKQSLRTQKEAVYQRTIFIMLLLHFIRAGRGLQWRRLQKISVLIETEC